MEELRSAVVVEDDPDIRFLLETTLTQAGFEVHASATGTDGVELVRAHNPLVTTLDIALPDIDGLEVARRVRRFSTTYLVMLTGRAAEIDTLLGLDAGADDYITKPFRPRELRARIEAMLRRPRTLAGFTSGGAVVAGQAAPTNGTITGAPHPVTPADVLAASASGHHPTYSGAPAPTAASPGASPSPFSPGSPAEPAVATAATRPVNRVLSHRGLVVDVDARTAELDGQAVSLTRTEFDLLVALVESPTRVLRKDELVQRAWADSYDTGAVVSDADRHSVEVHVANLRRKLGDGPGHPRFIETVRGVGYRLRR
ncbi:response regulator transcription factor [Georgenia deserti]|uniref:Response regulator transcription factor n=1 Tax=Georgenia deserti TaxID=2093781 RepID=A0ABW4L1V2_9MICO